MRLLISGITLLRLFGLSKYWINVVNSWDKGFPFSTGKFFEKRNLSINRRIKLACKQGYKIEIKSDT